MSPRKILISLNDAIAPAKRNPTDTHSLTERSPLEDEKARLKSQEPIPETKAVYGYCPQCGAIGKMRERRINGNDVCSNGHHYRSGTGLKVPPI